MTFGQLISETRLRWMKTIKLLKRSKRKTIKPQSSTKSNQVLPVITTTAADTISDTSLDTFYSCHNSFENRLNETNQESCSACYDSAYDTDQGSQKTGQKHSIAITTVTYLNVKEKEDTGSISTIMTWIECDGDGTEVQNAVNEKIELMASL